MALQHCPLLLSVTEVAHLHGRVSMPELHGRITPMVALAQLWLFPVVDRNEQRITDAVGGNVILECVPVLARYYSPGLLPVSCVQPVIDRLLESQASGLCHGRGCAG